MYGQNQKDPWSFLILLKGQLSPWDAARLLHRPQDMGSWLQAKPICVAVCPDPSGSFPNHEASPSHFSSSALGVLVCEGVAVTSRS